MINKGQLNRGKVGQYQADVTILTRYKKQIRTITFY
jgi:hypothetical protein